MDRGKRAGFKVLLTFCSATAVAACSSLEGYPREPETPGQISLLRNAFYGPHADDGYYSESDPLKRKWRRDVLIYGKMGVIESDFDDLERALNGTGNSVSIFGDLGVLTLNGIGAVTGGKSTKAALSAASAGIVGAQGAISKDLYYQRTLPAILAQMEANREAVRAQIIANLQKSDAEYPLPAAEIELKRLIRAGSIPSSISGITQAADASKKHSEQAIDDLRSVSFSSAPSAERLATWLAPAGVADPVRTKAFQAWIKDQPDAAYLAGVPFAIIVRAPDPVMEAVRQRALADPTLGIPK
jgi:hypothetical protein